jgi:hypothetical protein
MRKLVAAAAALLALSAGCSSGGDDWAQRFSDAVEGGDDCPVLFELRNRMDEKSDDYAEANVELRRVGCFMSSSTRTDR